MCLDAPVCAPPDKAAIIRLDTRTHPNISHHAPAHHHPHPLQLLLESSAKSGGAGSGFDVARSGDGRVALIGFPR